MEKNVIDGNILKSNKEKKEIKKRGINAIEKTKCAKANNKLITI